MTLAPFVDPSVRGVEGRPQNLPKWCVVPGCLSLAQERHHLFPRSFLRGQPIEWVTVQDETRPNSVGLCIRHHLSVTSPVGGHIAHVRWNETHKIFDWWENEGHLLSEGEDRWVRVGPLRSQAIVPEEPKAPRARRQENLCPSCGKPKERERKPGPRRKVKQWTVSVPDDAEVGTDVLDVYVEDLGYLMGFHDSQARLLRYHVLVPALEWVAQNRREFLNDWEET